MVTASPPEPPRTVPWLVFDGDCGFCTTTATWLARRMQQPGSPAARLVPWQRTDLAALGTTAERAQQEVLWVRPAGVVSGGAEAIAAWLRYRGRQSRGLPYLAVGTLLDGPGVRQLAAAVYRLVAANRSRLPGGTPACALPRPDAG